MEGRGGPKRGFTLFLLVLLLCPLLLSISPPVNDQGEPWQQKVVSTSSGRIHFQWRYEEKSQAEAFLIYRGEGEANPLASEENLQQILPWQTLTPSEHCFYDEENLCWNCFFTYLPEDEEEGKKTWFLIRSKTNGLASTNLEAEQVTIDLPWVDGWQDPNVIYFYIEDEKRRDSFSSQDWKCPYCGQSGQIFLRLVKARCVYQGTRAWSYLDNSMAFTESLKEAATSFENEIYPKNGDYFGRTQNQWTDVDENGHLILLFTSLRHGVRGYFQPEDKYLASLEEKDQAGLIANGADILYLSSEYSPTEIRIALAHEFQHMQHFEMNADYLQENQDQEFWEELWLNETCSKLAEEVNNLLDAEYMNWQTFAWQTNQLSLTRFGPQDVHARFGGCPFHLQDEQGNYIPENTDAYVRMVGHYDKVALWGHYMEYEADPITSLASLVADPNKGLVSVRNHLGRDIKQVFVDFTITNFANIYQQAEDSPYHYRPQFRGGAELLTSFQVMPRLHLEPDLVKSPEEIPAWQDGFLRDMTADYLLADYHDPNNNSLNQGSFHWEFMGVNSEENIGHLVQIDYSNPQQPRLHEVVEVAFVDEAAKVVINEGGRDLSSCFILTNIAQYREDDYLSTYSFRVYKTQPPSIVRVRVWQGKHGMVVAEDTMALQPGAVQVQIQFDQVMSKEQPVQVLIDPQGEGSGSGPSSFLPGSAPWSTTQYPNDTWVGEMLIPKAKWQEWDGQAQVQILKAHNAWGESLLKTKSLYLRIETRSSWLATDDHLCFVSQLSFFYLPLANYLPLAKSRKSTSPGKRLSAYSSRVSVS